MVTGGAGFIGSHIADALINEGYEVVIVDNLSTGSSKNINPKARFYEINICSPELGRIFESERPQIVCHQAAQTVISRSVSDPVFDANVNILGSVNLISNCLHYRVKKLIYASSGGAVYGEPKYLPANEEHPVDPLSQYGASKHSVEHYLYLYWLQHGLDYVSLRYSNVYGPRQNPDGEAGVIAIFTGQMLRGERPTIFGKGDKTRDYTYVTDIARANVLAILAGKTGIYNLGTGVETSDRQIFDLVAQNLGYKEDPNFTRVRKGEIYRICLDSSKATAELGWQPLTSVKDGIAQTVAFLKSNS